MSSVQKGALILARVEVMTVSIPLKVTVSHNLADRRVANNVLVSVTEPAGLQGWGECCPREYVTGESVDSVLATLDRDFIPHFLHGRFEDFGAVMSALSDLGRVMRRNQQAAFCALELAVLDLASRYFEVPVEQAIGFIMHSKFEYSAVVAAGDEASARKLAERFFQFGLRSFKVKTGADLDRNRAIIGAVRDVIGMDTDLRIDANEAWDGAEAVQQLDALREFSLTGVEQPVPAEDLEGMVQVVAAGITPVVADESLCSAEDAAQLIEQRGADVFNIRISKCGGLINSMRLAKMAWDAGLRCQLGAQVGETGILSAAGRHFAASARDLIWLEGSFDSLLLDRIITKPDTTLGPGGRAVALAGYGLGIEVLADELQTVLTSHKVFS